MALREILQKIIPKFRLGLFSALCFSAGASFSEKLNNHDGLEQAKTYIAIVSSRFLRHLHTAMRADIPINLQK